MIKKKNSFSWKNFIDHLHQCVIHFINFFNNIIIKIKFILFICLMFYFINKYIKKYKENIVKRLFNVLYWNSWKNILILLKLKILLWVIFKDERTRKNYHIRGRRDFRTVIVKNKKNQINSIISDFNKDWAKSKDKKKMQKWNWIAK